MILGVNVCDFSKCNKGPNGQRMAVQIDTLRAQNDPSYGVEIDDAFFRFLNVRANYEMPVPNQRESVPREKQFCSAGCLRDFFSESNYSAPLSPRQQAVIAENNRKVEEARKATVDGFGKPTETEPKTAKVLEWPKSNLPAEAEPK
jgi:hypothetical protein